ncbi:MAG TPA: putative O-glycosylation ligase, exosortase A system-associated [Azospirillum sp.]|nr:putative O-glycosylation ligase, exosortase A system-associated [Azospirillum sp.]
MRSMLLTALILGALPFVLWTPHLGVLVWAWVSFMVPHRLTFGMAYTFPFAQVVFLTTIAAWVLSREPKTLPLTPTTVLFALFFGWITLTTLAAVNPDAAWIKWNEAWKKFLGVALILALMRSRGRIVALIAVIAGSLAFYGVKGGLFTVLSGGRHIVLGPPGSYIQDNNALAVAMAMSLPLLWFLRGQTGNHLLRMGLLVAAGLVTVAVIGTFSRGGFLTLAVMLGFLWLRSPHKVMTAGVFAVLVALSLTVIDDRWFDRINTIQEYEEDGSARGRIEAWGHALNIVASRPLTGAGFEAFLPSVFAIYTPGIAPRAAHSIYFEMLGEHGFPGLALFLTIGLFAFRNCAWVRRAARGRADLAWAVQLASMLPVTFAAYAVGGAFLSIAYLEPLYALVAVAALTRWVVARDLRLAEGARPVPSGASARRSGQRAVAGG